MAVTAVETALAK